MRPCFRYYARLFLAPEPKRALLVDICYHQQVILGNPVRTCRDNLAGVISTIEPAVRAAVKDIGYEQENSITRILSFKGIYMSNRGYCDGG